ncbi:cyanate transporter [Achromobacter sp. AONIH1]|uniref:cyanate transporter n=1 Tax=Achromobacter sp. AONIH1 TaxID=1758194 RepID=UPI000CD1A924|nr:cyanate transporter [Achromobacter sp. AONIH1]AUT49864.1 MFS transporter [Achromobacter sp. AONIH1]
MTRAGTRAGNPAPAGLLLAAIALVALNLRPFIAGIGPLAADIGAHTGLDLKRMSLLTLVPMLLMGLVAFAGPAVQARLGGRRAVLLALALLAAGSSLRLWASAGWQLIGTAAMLGLGAAVVQAVLPGIIKRQFPRHVGVVMGLYSSMLMAGGALGAQLSPLAAAASGDWRIGLAWMAVPALLALALAARSLPPDEAVRSGRMAAATYLARPRVWLLMACFGLVNGGYSSVVAWLAPFYQERGWSAAASGSLLAALTVCQAAAALLLPVLARKHEDRRPWLWLTLVLQAAGFAALAWRPDAAPIAWAMLLGAGLGGCFALSLIVALDHLPDPLRAGVLSSYVQGGGFLIAAAPPWIVAALREATGGFRDGWLLHLACVAVVAALYLRAAPSSYARAMAAPRADAARAGSGGS